MTLRNNVRLIDIGMLTKMAPPAAIMSQEGSLRLNKSANQKAVNNGYNREGPVMKLKVPGGRKRSNAPSKPAPSKLPANPRLTQAS